MNKDIVVIKYVSDDESQKFVVTVKEKNILVDHFYDLSNCILCDEKDTCESYSVPDDTYEYEFEDDCDLFEEIGYFLNTCFSRSVAIVLNSIIQGILVNDPNGTVTITFNDDLKLLSCSLDQLEQQMIS